MERKSLVYCASLLAGSTTSLLITALMLRLSFGYWFIPAWPGMLLTSVHAMFETSQNSTSPTSLLLITIGNAIFYAWLSLRVLRAEVQARGHLSRYFLR